ncbi:hypothetical protein GCM10027176_45530 [Actinoallomurus bryophytorum]|uniref:NAD-dependent epimerase/dehydratase family protein n=1 Tax=Actinoallomurus bryophytorum TaxID=1490222 RepID=A0A543CCH9_9ACTN|nr:NAD-dependent epimerase/dehydratase family protein [Actinoallomurus bryophytorum]TQL94796.1 NAD-dependent epimerase/dehydratase family protein [Actinoallomurus bryophytorum]
MTEILVTGGTGVLGRRLVGRLAGAADVRVLSRGAGEIAGARVLRGDLETGEGLRAAADGAGVIVHAASTGTDIRKPGHDIGATRRLLEAIPGRAMAAYRAGHHLAPAGATGVRGFAEDLRERIGSDGVLRPPYDLRRR